MALYDRSELDRPSLREQSNNVREAAGVAPVPAAVRIYRSPDVSSAAPLSSMINKPTNQQHSTPPKFAALVLSLVAILVTSELLLFQEAPLSTKAALGLGSFVLLAVLSESFPLTVPMGNAVIGVSGTIYWAMVVLFDPFWASSCAFAGFLIAELTVRKRTPSKAVFNAAQVGLSTLLASLMFIAVQGSSGLNATPEFFLAFVLAVLVYWLFNTGMVSIGAWILYQERPDRFWQRNFQWAWIYELTSAPVALAVAFAYVQLSVVGLLLLALPILMIRLAYSQYLNLKKTYRETVRTLIKIIEMHDPYTAGHSDRVATYSRRLCENLNLSPGRTEHIELAAYLHDLGKIHLDLTGLVRKAGKLTEEERRLVRLHPDVSADLANEVTYFQGEIEEVIRHHHENWDGSGYPRGLKGNEIPLGARIILLADAFDAMTTSRVYRDALDIELVKDEFRKFAGIQFDPDLVPVFLEKVVGDGSGMIRQPPDETLESQRARSPEIVLQQAQVRSIHSRVVN